MAESEQQVEQVEQVDDEEKPSVNYQPPAPKSIEEIMQADQEDESLQKYKAQLLGKDTVFWPDDPRKVILRKMSILVEGRADEEINLEDESQLKNMKFVMKEKAKYRIMITFNVQREIVSGLKLHNKITKLGIGTGEDYMVGSYGPKREVHEYKSPVEEFPGGMIGRGDYKVKSTFKDDDGNTILSWEWDLVIKKEWKKE